MLRVFGWLAIGTLWGIDDHTAVQIAEAFYATLTKEAVGSVPDASDAALAFQEAGRIVPRQPPRNPVAMGVSHPRRCLSRQTR